MAEKEVGVNNMLAEMAGLKEEIKMAEEKS